MVNSHLARLWKVRPKIDAPRNGLWLGPGGDGSDGVWLGSLAETVDGRQPSIWLSTSKEQVVAVVGKRGSGKSFTLGVIVEGLVSGKENRLTRQLSPRAVLLFDPLDVHWTTRYPVTESENQAAQGHFEMAKSAGLPELTYGVDAWVPGEQNRLATDPEWFQTLRISISALQVDEWEILLGFNALSDPMGQALVDVIDLVARRGFHVADGFRPPVQAYDFTDLEDALQADELSGRYRDETVRALRQRLGALSLTGLFAANGTKVRELLKPGSATVIALGRLPQSYRAAIVAVLTRMLIEIRSQSAFAEKRLSLDPDLSATERTALRELVENGAPRTTVVLDEAQAFLAPGAGNAALDLFVRLVKEGRNLGLSAVLATQQPSAIDRRVLSQVEVFMAHQLVTEADIRAVRENLKADLPESVQSGSQLIDPTLLLRHLSIGSCLVSAADMNCPLRRSILLAVRPRATVHGGIEL